MIPLTQLHAVPDGRAFLRTPPSVILSGHNALAGYRPSSRRNLGRSRAVGQGARSYEIRTPRKGRTGAQP